MLSAIGVIGLEDRRCLRPLLRLRCCFLGFSAYSGGKIGKAWAIGGCRGGAGASWRKGVDSSSSQSSPKRSASLMKELGELRYSRDLPVGHDG